MSRIIKATAVSTQPIMGDGMPTFTIREKTQSQDDFRPIHDLRTDIDEIEDLTPEQLLADAKIEAKKIIEDANSQSIAYIKATTERLDAELELNLKKGFDQGHEKGIEEGRKLGYERGYEKGYDDGVDAADVEYDKNIKFMQGVIEGIDDAKHLMLKKYESSLSDVAFTMAKMVIKKELEVDPKLLNKIIEDAASTCKNQEYILVTLSESGYKIVTKESDSVAEILKTYSDDVRFFVDKTMSDNDCIIETPVGVIDASVKTQLENISTALKDVDNQDN